MIPIQSCMGGWCTRRDSCAHYHAASEGQTPAERLCPPGHDGAGLQHFTDEHDMTRPYLSAEERRRQALSFLTTEGVPLNQLRDAMGYRSAENAAKIMAQLIFAGMAFSCRSRVNPNSHGWDTVYFSTEESRDAYVAARRAQMLEKARQRKRDTAYRLPYYLKRNEQRKIARAEKAKLREERKAREAQEKAEQKARMKAEAKALRAAEAELRKQRQRLDREAKAAEKQREKAQAKSQAARLRAQTRAASQLAKVRGTSTPAPVKPSGPAHLAGPAIVPADVKVTRYPTPPDRFAVLKAPSVVSSRECRAWAEAAAA